MHISLPRLIRSLSLSIIIALGATFNPVTLTEAHAIGKVSRACKPLGANESITVDWWFTPHYMLTYSVHYNYGSFVRILNSNWTYSWRSYAGLFFDYLGSPYVNGWHFYYTPVAGQIFLGDTYAWDCNLSNWGF